MFGNPQERYILRMLHRVDMLPEWNGETFEWDSDKVKDLISLAKAGDADADAGLCAMAMPYLSRGLALPQELANHVHGVLLMRFAEEWKPRRGGNPYANRWRDTVIHM